MSSFTSQCILRSANRVLGAKKGSPNVIEKIVKDGIRQGDHIFPAVSSARALHTTGNMRQPYDDENPKIRGIDILRDPQFNKGMGFKLKERQTLGIHGLLPPRIVEPEEQLKRVIGNVRHWKSNLDKYIYLIALQDRNEKLFYRALREYIEELAPIVYTPTVGQACERFGFIFRRPRGLYITINDAGHIYEVLQNWPERDVKVICVTDGERILGLGDLGAFGMGIPIGKLSLYTAMGGVPPHQCLPVVIDVGTDRDRLLEADDYIGLQHKRVRGQKYVDLIEEFLDAVQRRFGRSCLVQFEDFANRNAFWLLEKYRDRYCTFNDDIQGTASVVLAGLLAAQRETGLPITEQKYLFLGAGEAAIGIANLLTRAMMEEGLTKEEATGRIWMVDIDGLLTKERPKGEITSHQELYAKDYKHMDNLEEICREIKPNVALGVAAATGAFTPQFLQDMASFNERPVVFALSNPTSKAECTAEQAYTNTNGRCIFASGSPFDPVSFNGHTFHPGQGNNAYIFPGVGMGAIVAKSYFVTDGMFLIASKALAELVTDEHLAEGRVYPPIKDIFEVSTHIATRIVEYAYKKGIAGTYPEPEDKLQFVRDHQYTTDYESFLPSLYNWPGVIDQ